MTKYDVQKIMLEAAKVTLFFDEKKIHYVAGRTPDGSDEMVIEGKGHIDAEFVDNIVKQTAKECIHQILRCTLRNGDSEHNLALYKAMDEIKIHFGI
jgi:hypothetical protein